MSIDIQRGARLLLRPQGTLVIGLASTGINGVLVMRAPGEIARVDADRLTPWDDGDVWTGPALDWLALPSGMRLTIEYYEAKGQLSDAEAAGWLLSDRETAGLMIVTHGLARAASGEIQGAGFSPAVVALLREADGERPEAAAPGGDEHGRN